LSASFNSAGSGLDDYASGIGQNHLQRADSAQVEKPSKKTVMVGVEYEALLQSALEDQAIFFEGEIARLTAELTRSLVDEGTMTSIESTQIEQLQHDIQKIQDEIEVASADLLAAQAQEAERRAASRKLLSEQQVSTELLKKIQEEHRKENNMGKQQIEDLEQQIADLNANLRMRHQFSSNEELSNAQIFGTTTTESPPKAHGKRGKKKGKNNQK
jgi:septal ring factor EnvC (AmiA/AmiB activator)